MQWNYLLNMLGQLDYYKILKYVFFHTISKYFKKYSNDLMSMTK